MLLSDLNYRKCKSVNTTSLSHLVTANVLSKFMVKKTAGSGLSNQHLKGMEVRVFNHYSKNKQMVNQE